MGRRENTRKRLQEALLEALQVDSFDKITVVQVAEIAGITRSTFYLHYANVMEIVDDLIEKAMERAATGRVLDDNNLAFVAQTLQKAESKEALRQAYEKVFPRLPLCQRIAADSHYGILFNDSFVGNYLLKTIYEEEKQTQAPWLAKQLGVSLPVAESVFYFCLQGLYAVNQTYHWQRTDECLEAQRTIFTMLLRGLKCR